MVVGIGKFCHKCYGRHYIGIFFLALLCFYRGKIQILSDIAACFSEKGRKKMNKPKRTRQDERMNGEKHVIISFFIYVSLLPSLFENLL